MPSVDSLQDLRYRRTTVQVFHEVSETLRTAITKLHPVPFRNLVDFERVTVSPGEVQRIAFPAFDAKTFELVNATGGNTLYTGEHALVFSRGHGEEVSLNFTLS